MKTKVKAKKKESTRSLSRTNTRLKNVTNKLTALQIKHKEVLKILAKANKDIFKLRSIAKSMLKV